MSKPVALLLVDVAGPWGQALCHQLPADAYHICTVTGQAELFPQLAQNIIDLIILGLVDKSEKSLRACVAVRKRSIVPMVLLGMMMRPDEIVRGLEAGADDVIDLDKINGRILHLRLSVLLRRARQRQQQSIHQVGGIVLNPVTREVSVRGRPVQLRPLEYQLLHYLITHPRQPLSKRILIDGVWDQEHNDNTVETTVRRLRQKIEQDPSRPEHLVTMRGLGYAFL